MSRPFRQLSDQLDDSREKLHKHCRKLRKAIKQLTWGRRLDAGYA